MAEFKLINTNTVTIRVHALNAQIISGGLIKPIAPNTGPSIPGKRPSVGIVEWQIPANKLAAYKMLVQMPRQQGVALNQHKIKRSVTQKSGGSTKHLPSSSGNPKTTQPSNSLPNNQVIYAEIVKFK